MIRRITILLLLSLLLNVSGAVTQTRPNACWIWRSSDLTLADTCREWVLYQGDFYAEESPRFVKRGIQPVKIDGRELVLLFRLNGLVDTAYLAAQISYAITQWRHHGIDIQHIQLDYDSPSSALTEYAAMVRTLKGEMPQVHLSATGLVTWYEDNPRGVERLANELDYIAFQLYQDYTPLPDTQRLTQRLINFPYTYRLGITRHTDFSSMRIATGNNYRGSMLFLNVRN